MKKMSNERRSIAFDIRMYNKMMQVADMYKEQYGRFISVAEVMCRLIDQDSIIYNMYNIVKEQQHCER